MTEDPADGWTALELLRDAGGKTENVARVVYWDAQGQFFLEMLVDEIPLIVVEELMREAKARIRVG